MGTRGECRDSKQQRSGSTSDEQQRRSEDASAVDAHQGENNAAGTVVEEFQFFRRHEVDLDLLSKSLQENLLHGQTRTAKSLFCWRFAQSRSSLALPITSTSSALHADWKTNALHHQGYIAKWFVRTVCGHRDSSGGNGSCMAPIVVNLFWALSICRWQCTTCSAPCKFKTKKCWSFPGRAHQRELLRCMGRREWSAISANWKVPRCKSRVATLSSSRIHQALVEHFSSWTHRCQWDPPGSRWSLLQAPGLIFLLVSARSSFSLSLAQYLPFSVFFLSASVLFYKCLRGPPAKSYKARL